jgi:hypothetical protein
MATERWPWDLHPWKADGDMSGQEEQSDGMGPTWTSDDS